MSDNVMATGRIEFVNNLNIKVKVDGRMKGYTERFFLIKNCKGFFPEAGQNVVFNFDKNLYFDDLTYVYLDKPFPRYFFSKDWQNKDIAYIMVTNSKCDDNWVVYKNGEMAYPGNNSLYRCLGMNWAELTGQEAKARLDKAKFPRYFSTASVPWYNDLVYVIIEENGESFEVNKQGKIFKSDDTLERSEKYVKECCWKEITKEEAEKLVVIEEPFPKYFVNDSPIWADMAYFQIDDKISFGTWCYKDGEREQSGCYSYTNFSTGKYRWKEVAKGEAEKLVVGKKPLFPRYFTETNSDTYIIFRDNNKSEYVNKQGRSGGWVPLSSYEQWVKEGWKKEITKEEAETLIAPKFPRYFTGDRVSLATGYAYILVNDGAFDNRMICENGKSINEGAYNLSTCLDYVRKGSWKEITKEQAEALIAKPISLFAKEIVAVIQRHLATELSAKDLSIINQVLVVLEKNGYNYLSLRE